MTKNEAKKMAQKNKRAVSFLLSVAHTPIEMQRRKSEKISKEFEIFWRSSPNIEQFKRVVDGVLLTAEMLYFMVTHGR